MVGGGPLVGFNPRPLTSGRPAAIEADLIDDEFQSTPAHERATFMPAMASRPAKFQSTPAHERATVEY